MKYWEIVKSVTQNPALSGVAVIDSIRYELYVNDSGTLESKTYYLELGTSGTSIGKAGKIDFDGWEIVRQPVPWQEAIQAWVEGKRVTLKFDRCEYDFCGFSDKSNTRRAIKSGTWYVVD